MPYSDGTQTIWFTWTSTSASTWNADTTSAAIAANNYQPQMGLVGYAEATWLGGNGAPQVRVDANQQMWSDWFVHGTTAVQLPHPIPVESTPEQRRQVRCQELVRRNRARARGLRLKLAARRAEALLLDNLDERQRQDWAATRAFHVETRKGSRRWLIRKGRQHNVYLLRDGDREAAQGRHRTVKVGDVDVPFLNELCIYVKDEVPHEDTVLAQKLLLEADEEQFAQVANWS
jgi:hypothetical protein